MAPHTIRFQFRIECLSICYVVLPSQAFIMKIPRRTHRWYASPFWWIRYLLFHVLPRKTDPHFIQISSLYPLRTNMNLQQKRFFENCQKASSILFLGYHLNSVLLVLWERVFAIQFYFNIPVCAGGFQPPVYRLCQQNHRLHYLLIFYFGHVVEVPNFLIYFRVSTASAS